MSDWRQKSVIWLRIWSFFIGREVWEMAVGRVPVTGSSYHGLPTKYTVENGNSVIGTHGTCQYTGR